jgi:hypothetical protein
MWPVQYQLKPQSYQARPNSPGNRPNKIILLIGVYSTALHILLQLIMFFYLAKFNFISYNMLYYEWYNGSITVLLYIEHAVWLHILWTLARPPYISLIITYAAVLVIIIAWTMEVVVPVEPDPFDYHGKFCIVFVIGSTVNCIGSLYLLPGKAQGVDPTYKTLCSITTGIAVLASAIWYGKRVANGIGRANNVDFTSFNLHEPSFEITSYSMYLAGLGVVMDFWAHQMQ